MEDLSQYDVILQRAIDLLKPILESASVDQGHDINHSTIVMNHVRQALSCNTADIAELTDREKLCLLMAALLHDADDHKFFPDHHSYENARSIMQKLSPSIISESDIELVIRMISYVSCSQNKNKTISPTWLLYPRYADRLEALGDIGVIRAYVYGQKKGSPLFTATTARPTNTEQLYKEVATAERFDQYSGASASFIDHFYDKLLHLNNLETTNPYFLEEMNCRHQLMEDYVLRFGRTGQIDMDKIRTWAQKYRYQI